MIYCSVKQCSSRGIDVKMHVLPTNNELRLRWLKKIGREDLKEKNRRNYAVCDKHFSKDQKFVTMRYNTKLINNAVPDTFLPVNLPKISFEPQSASSFLDTESLSASEANCEEVLEVVNPMLGQKLVRQSEVSKCNQLSSKNQKNDYRLTIKRQTNKLENSKQQIKKSLQMLIPEVKKFTNM